MLETGSPYGSVLAGLHELRALDAAGMFRHAAGIIVGQLSEEEENMLVKFLKYEARREDIPVLSNVDFVHRTPMTVVPMGAMANGVLRFSPFEKLILQGVLSILKKQMVYYIFVPEK